MARYTVPMATWANTTVEVEVPDHVTDPEEIADLALEQMDPPTLCHQCTGGWRGASSLDLGDVWEPARFDGKPDVNRLD